MRHLVTRLGPQDYALQRDDAALNFDDNFLRPSYMLHQKPDDAAARSANFRHGLNYADALNVLAIHLQDDVARSNACPFRRAVGDGRDYYEPPVGVHGYMRADALESSPNVLVFNSEHIGADVVRMRVV